MVHSLNAADIADISSVAQTNTGDATDEVAGLLSWINPLQARQAPHLMTVARKIHGIVDLKKRSCEQVIKKQRKSMKRYWSKETLTRYMRSYACRILDEEVKDLRMLSVYRKS
jgi:hypothetical protein